MTRQTPHPGEVLKGEFLGPLGMSANSLALAMGVPITHLADIIDEQEPVTADIANRLSKHFGNPVEFWLVLQADYDTSLSGNSSI